MLQINNRSAGRPEQRASLSVYLVVVFIFIQILFNKSERFYYFKAADPDELNSPGACCTSTPCRQRRCLSGTCDRGQRLMFSSSPRLCGKQEQDLELDLKVEG